MRSNYQTQREERLFFLAWSLFLLSVLLMSLAVVELDESENLSKLLKLMRYGAYAICCIKILLSSIRERTVWYVGIMLAIFLVSCLTSGDKTMVLYSLILIAALDTDGKKVIQITAVLQAAIISITVVLSQLGILEDYVFGIAEGRIRHGLGFSWTTTAPILFLYCMLSYIYLKREQFSIFHAAVLEVINVWMFVMTDSKMAFFLSTLFLAFFAFQGWNRKRWKWISKFSVLFPFVPLILLILSLFAFLRYDAASPAWQSFNHLLSSRLSLGHNAIETFGFSWFGQEIEWVGFSVATPTINEAVGYNYVDSSYLQMMLHFGTLFILAVLAVYAAAIRKAIRIKDYYLVAIYMIILVFSLTEPRMMNFAFNPFPLLAFCRIPAFTRETCRMRPGQARHHRRKPLGEL